MTARQDKMIQNEIDRVDYHQSVPEEMINYQLETFSIEEQINNLLSQVLKKMSSNAIHDLTLETFKGEWASRDQGRNEYYYSIVLSNDGNLKLIEKSRHFWKQGEPFDYEHTSEECLSLQNALIEFDFDSKVWWSIDDVSQQYELPSIVLQRAKEGFDNYNFSIWRRGNCKGIGLFNRLQRAQNEIDAIVKQRIGEQKRQEAERKRREEEAERKRREEAERKCREEAEIKRRRLYDLKNSNIGDSVVFGHKTDGAMSWTVVDKRQGEAILLKTPWPKYRYYGGTLDFKGKTHDIKMPFDQDGRTNLWESCSLKKWLNTVFYNDCFTDEERTLLVNTQNGNLKEYISILSDVELEKYKQFLPELFASGFYYSEDDVCWIRTISRQKSRYVYGKPSCKVKGKYAPAWAGFYYLCYPKRLGYVYPVIKIDLQKIVFNDEKSKAEEEAKHKAEEERKRKEQHKFWISNGFCQYCGGEFKGLFKKKCVVCGHIKDY